MYKKLTPWLQARATQVLASHLVETSSGIYGIGKDQLELYRIDITTSEPAMDSIDSQFQDYNDWTKTSSLMIAQNEMVLFVQPHSLVEYDPLTQKKILTRLSYEITLPGSDSQRIEALTDFTGRVFVAFDRKSVRFTYNMGVEQTCGDKKSFSITSKEAADEIIVDITARGDEPIMATYNKEQDTSYLFFGEQKQRYSLLHRGVKGKITSIQALDDTLLAAIHRNNNTTIYKLTALRKKRIVTLPEESAVGLGTLEKHVSIELRDKGVSYLLPKGSL